MEGKLAKLPEMIDIRVVNNSKVKAILEEIANASSIEVTSADKKKIETKSMDPLKAIIKLTSTKKSTKKKSTEDNSVKEKIEKRTGKKAVKKTVKKKVSKKKSRFAKKKQTKTTTKKTEKTPGIIMSVLEFIQNDGPISAKKILAKLVKRFPNRDSDSMERTIPRVPNHLKTNFGIDKIRKNDKGNYYIKK